jgi:Phage tail lysozyme
VADSSVLQEYLIKLGLDKDSVKNLKSQMADIEKSVNVIKFIELAKALVEVAKAFFEVARAAEAFVEKTVKADMEVQIFSKRLLTTVSNARSLKSVMDAMGIHSLEDLRDVALNPTLRAQFMGLRHFTQGLEPGAGVKEGIGNFRDVGYSLQKIQVLLSYFSQYVVGALGKLLEGPLKHLGRVLDDFSSRFKSQISLWAAKVATALAYVWKFCEIAAQIITDLYHLFKSLGLDHFLMAMIDFTLAVMYLIRDIFDWIQARWPKVPKPVQTALKIGALTTGGAAIGSGIGAVIGGALGIPAGPLGVAGGALSGGAAGGAIGGGIGAGIGIGSSILDKHGNDISSNWEKSLSQWHSTGMAASNKSRIVSFLQSQGFSDQGIAAILANATAESGLSTSRVGDHGTSVGLFQWHAGRWASGSSFLGKNLKDASIEEQLSFLLHELQSRPALFRNLKSRIPAGLLAAQFVRDFENPADVPGQSAMRGAMANTIIFHIHETVNPKHTAHAVGRKLANMLPTRSLQSQAT